MQIMRKPKSLILLAGLAALGLGTVLGAKQAYSAKCVESLWPSANRAGVTRATFNRAFQGFQPDPEVVEAAKYQPEYVKPIGEYVDRAVSAKRLEKGKEKLVEYKPLLDALEARYGVDRHILVAIWGVESNYGEQPGDKNVIHSLATLICTGTKSKYARSQINSALKIMQRGDVPFDAMNGSWAGAMGHTQFIPTTYSAYAADYDGDGKRDIWTNIPDALASTASYLKVSKWQPGQTWGYEVKLPNGFNPRRVSKRTLKSLGQWQKLGIVRINGQPFPRQGDKASLFAPEGTRGPAFLVLNNFRSIRRYNVAEAYALAVGHLADRLAGYGPFIQPWPTDEKRLSLEQRTELQQLLIARGFMGGEPDGIIGPDTLDGVRSYQRARKLPVDGYPTQTILNMLRAEIPPPLPVRKSQIIGQSQSAEAVPPPASQDQTGSIGQAQPAKAPAPPPASQDQTGSIGGAKPAPGGVKLPAGQPANAATNGQPAPAGSGQPAALGAREPAVRQN
jgi:membrane-bound lytic murein transglycosylase B